MFFAVPLFRFFEQFYTLFIVGEVPEECVLNYTKKFVENTGRDKWPWKNLLFTPLLWWYSEHKLTVTNVYQTVDYKKVDLLNGLKKEYQKSEEK